MSLIGLAPSYAALAIILLTTGVSVACLHVSAPVMIHQAARDRVGRGMSFFMVAGELARTLGPLIAVQVVSWYGLEGMPRMIPVALGSGALLWWRLGALSTDRLEKPPVHVFAVWSRMRRVLLAVTGILIARAFPRRSPYDLPSDLSLQQRSGAMARERVAISARAFRSRGSPRIGDFERPRRAPARALAHHRVVAAIDDRLSQHDGPHPDGSARLVGADDVVDGARHHGDRARKRRRQPSRRQRHLLHDQLRGPALSFCSSSESWPMRSGSVILTTGARRSPASEHLSCFSCPRVESSCKLASLASSMIQFWRRTS